MKPQAAIPLISPEKPFLSFKPTKIPPKMKREGRQHGMVRTHRILPSPYNPKQASRFINTMDSPPTAGFFTKVQPRPTNHSKFTGKCGKPRCNGCHLHPCCKSKDKTKGAHKFRSNDTASNYRSITWRVVDSRPGLNFNGFSASGILDHLGRHNEEDDDYHVDSDDEIVGEETVLEEVQEIADAVNVDDDNMSFCDVGFVLDQVEGDEGWCLVAEM